MHRVLGMFGVFVLALTAPGVGSVSSAVAAVPDCGGTALGGPGFDFNGDGCSDAVVGLPERTVKGHRHAGAVEIDFGAPSVLLRARSILVTARHPHTGDRFGAAVVVSDAALGRGLLSSVVIGVPGREVDGIADSGAVVTVKGHYGAWSSRVALPERAFNQIVGRPHHRARLGSTVVLGDPTRGDVYVGAPGWTVGGKHGAGALVAAGLTWLRGAGGHAPAVFTEARPGVAGRPQAGDHFGAAIADLTDSAAGTDVLAVGAPGKAVHGVPGAGAVVEIVLSPGYTGATNGIVTQGSPGDPNTPERGDHFGASLCCGADGSGFYIGVPDEDVGSANDAGIVETYGGLDYARTLRQGARHFPGRPQSGDRFGAALSETFRGDDPLLGHCAGLVVGVPGQRVGAQRAAGEIDCGAEPPYRAGHGLPGHPVAGAHLGAALNTIDSGKWYYQDPGACDCSGSVPYLVTLIGVPGAHHGDGAVIMGSRAHAPVWRRSSDSPKAHYGAVL